MYDAKMLVDWYIKLVTEHPLISYIEDGIRSGDIAGWQLLCNTFRAKNIRSGVNKWFKSDFETIKQFTQMLQPNDDTDEHDEPVEEA
jgi:enolase